MSGDEKIDGPTITVKSTRFGEFTVPESTVIEIPQGIIGFPNDHKYVVLEHKPPFAWLHSTENPSLAFVIVNGFEFGADYSVPAPYNDSQIDLKQDDEWALMVIVTLRNEPSMSTANLKAPIVVNLRNRKALQLILDDARYSTRFPLWTPDSEGEKSEPEKK